MIPENDLAGLDGWGSGAWIDDAAAVTVDVTKGWSLFSLTSASLLAERLWFEEKNHGRRQWVAWGTNRRSHFIRREAFG